MNKMLIEKRGWEKSVYYFATKIIVNCNSCKKEVDLKKDRFGCINQPEIDRDSIRFFCRDCFTKIQKIITDNM